MSTTVGATGAVLPAGVLRDDILVDPVHQAARLAARQLLPYNYGTPLDAAGEQRLASVGQASLTQQASGVPAPALFQPLVIRGRTFTKNRIWVAPMCQYSSDDGFFNDWHLAHLGHFAIGGAGLVIIEATAVAFEGRITPLCAGLWKDEHISGLTRLARFLQSQDCRAGIQLAHAGRKGSTLPPFSLPRGLPLDDKVGLELGGWPEQVIAPSAEAFAADYHVPAAMSLEDIARVKRDFVASAQRAVAAGIEYIEIHAAHGYLFSEFLSSTSNKRTDAYGGSFENRTRFLRETAAEIKAVLPETVVFGVRLTCEEWVSEGWHIEDTIQLVGQLESAGVDFIDCSSGGNNAKQKIPAAPGFQVPFAEAVKKAYPNLAIGAVGLLTEPNEADLIVSSGRADVTLLGREFLRNPHWPLDAAQALGYDIEWAPQYQWGKRNRKTGVKHKSEL